MIDNLIKTCLKSRGLVIITILGIMALGIYQYTRMPVDAFPDISPIMVPVFAEAHGMAPEEVERLVSYPIESVMNGLPGVTQIKSTSAFGLAVIYVYFEDGMDIYFARQLVAERLTGAISKLPELDSPPSLGPISTGLGQIFMYYLIMNETVDTGGKDPNTFLRELNDWVVKFQLQTVPGVTDILSIGGHVLQYQIKVDPLALQKYELTLSDVVQAVQANNRNAGGQFLVLGSEEHLVRGLGLLRQLDEIGRIPVKVSRGQPVHISDIAEVDYGNEIRRGVVTLDGRREVVSGIVLKLFGENTSDVIDRLYEKVDQVQAALPSGIKLVPYYEQAELVHNATGTVKKALLEGVLLVLLVLVLFLGNFRTAVVVAVSLPFCALISILGMAVMNISANLMSLGGIAIAIGMLVDGAIVMVENIYRHLGMAENAQRKKLLVVLAAAKEVGRPIVFSVLIVVLVFLPIFTLEGVEGKMFTPLAITVSLALLGSILAALVMAPVLSFYLLRQKTRTKEFLFVRLLKAIYRPFLKTAIRYKIIVVCLAFLIFLASMTTLPFIGTEFIPTLEEGSILIGVTLAPSISLEQATRTVLQIEKQLLNFAEVQRIVSRVGRPEAGSHPHPVNYAEVQIQLKPLEQWSRYKTKAQLVEAMRHELTAFPGIQVNFTQPIQNAFDELLSGTRSQIAIKVFGEDLEILQKKANEILEAVTDVPGLVDASVEQSLGQPQVRVIARREECARYGVSVDDLLQLVEYAVGGEVIDFIYLNTRRFGIFIRYQEEYRSNPESLKNLRINTPEGMIISLSDVAEVVLTSGPSQINRENNQRRWMVQGNVRGRDLGSVIADIKQRIRGRVQLPAGVFVEFGGQFENQQRAMARLAIIVPIAILCVFLLLWMSVGSAGQAMIIITNVPLALIGGILGLWLTGEYLSVPASVGFIALFGIAVQDGVVMVSYFNQLRQRGKKLNNALLEGGLLRLRPVIMTSLTTLLGLLPLLLAQGIGADVQRPLAIVVVFGLGSSTILTLLVVPAFYGWLERNKEKDTV